MKKIVRSSHLSLRFYHNDGWTLETLKKYLTKGSIEDTSAILGDIAGHGYFRLAHNSELDIERLYENEVSMVHRWSGLDDQLSDLEYLKSFF